MSKSRGILESTPLSRFHYFYHEVTTLSDKYATVLDVTEKNLVWIELTPSFSALKLNTFRTSFLV